MKFLKYIIITLLVFPLASCTNNAPQDTMPAHRLVIALLDFSGSFDYAGESVGMLGHLVDELQPGDELIIRAIDDSNSGKDIVSAKFPEKKRPIDPENQRQVRTMKLRLKQLLQKINLNQESPHTDVLGPVYAASLRFAKAQKQEKFLLLFTDLEDNVRQTIPQGVLKLQGVKVVSLFISPKSIEEDIRIKETWMTFFEDAGANIEILNVTESRSRSPILLK